jgi:hypothetical protein
LPELLDGDETRTPRASDGRGCATYTMMTNEYGKVARACGYSGWEGLHRCVTGGSATQRRTGGTRG